MSQDPRRLRPQVKTPEPRTNTQPLNSNGIIGNESPGTIAPFDWDKFEERYKAAVEDASRDEEKILEEFDTLVQYFNIWAASARDQDTDRALKRLHTRQVHVRNSEMTLAQKKEHYTEVVRAFKSALALLTGSNGRH